MDYYLYLVVEVLGFDAESFNFLENQKDIPVTISSQQIEQINTLNSQLKKARDCFNFKNEVNLLDFVFSFFKNIKKI